MAETVSPAQHLDEHYGDVGFVLVDEPTDGGPGMTEGQAGAFLRGLRPAARETLGQAAKSLKNGG